MLINVRVGSGGIRNTHTLLARKILEYLQNGLSKNNRDGFLNECHQVYDVQKEIYPVFQAPEGYPEARMNGYPAWEEIIKHLNYFTGDADQIGDFPALDNGQSEDDRRDNQYKIINIVQDNSDRKNASARLHYPRKTERDLGFIVLGGMTMSRGMTLEGLVSTYFTRDVDTADTLMQYGRFFGHHVGYELLPRLWLRENLPQTYCNLAKLEEFMHQSIHDHTEAPGEITFLDVSGIGKITRNDRNAIRTKGGRETYTCLLERREKIYNALNAALTNLRKQNEPKCRYDDCCYVWENISQRQINQLVSTVQLSDREESFGLPGDEDNRTWFVVLSGVQRKEGENVYDLAGCRLGWRKTTCSELDATTLIHQKSLDSRHWAAVVDDTTREQYDEQYQADHPDAQGTRYNYKNDYIDGLLEQENIADHPILVITGIGYGDLEHPLFAIGYRGLDAEIRNRGRNRRNA